MTFLELKEQFVEHGFKVEDEDRFVLEKVSYSTININGKVTKQPHKSRLEVVYGGVCVVSDEDDSDFSNGDRSHVLDIIGDGGLPALTVCIDDFKDIEEILGI